jgi:sugar phosphate isomerase/epimerase
MKITYGVFSKHLNWLAIDELADALVEIGFDAVDLAVRPGGHVDPEKVDEELPRAVEALAARSVQCPTIVTPIVQADEQAERIVRAASASGVRAYRMGYLDYGESISESLENARRTLGGLAELNERYGIHGAYQNHAGKRVGSPVWDLYLLLGALPSKWIGCQYDVRHAVIEGGSSWPLGMRLLAPWIRSIVVKDGRWQKTAEGRFVPKSVPIGTGAVDWNLFVELLAHTSWEGMISVHYEFPLFAEDAQTLSRDELTRKTIAAMRVELERVRETLAPLAES